MFMDDGKIVTGIRHYSPDMREVLRGLYGPGYHARVFEQGFITNTGNFISRKLAWLVARSAGQINHTLGNEHNEELYSEHLY